MVDESCPYRKWLFDDMVVSSNGNHYCFARKDRQPGEYGGPGDYWPCDSDDHDACRHFLARQSEGVENKVE